MSSFYLNRDKDLSIDDNLNELKDDNREFVLNDYRNAIIKNKELFKTGNEKAGSEYIYIYKSKRRC